MGDIKCPHCGKEFSLCEDNYESIVNQVQNQEFERIIREYKRDLDEKNEQEIKLAIADAKSDFEEKRRDYLYQIEELKKENEMYQNFKFRLSTKMVGETLEKHCALEVERIKTLIPNATFEKDTISKESGKGDFMYREQKDGIELISIMFEMKNEEEGKSNKTKNSNHFKKLDANRKEKNCEFAVLVSMLEKDNDYYNAGIVEAGKEYPKMYVVRPQCFVPIILLLRDVALNTFEYKKELAELKSQQIELSNFERNIDDFKELFFKHVGFANDRHDEAIAHIENTIEILSNVINILKTSDKHLSDAQGTLNRDLTIKKLTKDAPTIKAKLDEIRENQNQIEDGNEED